MMFIQWNMMAVKYIDKFGNFLDFCIWKKTRFFIDCITEGKELEMVNSFTKYWCELDRNWEHDDEVCQAQRFLFSINITHLSATWSYNSSWDGKNYSTSKLPVLCHHGSPQLPCGQSTLNYFPSWFLPCSHV